MPELFAMRLTRANKPNGYLLGSYRIATAPEPNSSRLTSLKSIDLHRTTEPKFVGDFGLRGSVFAGLTGRIAVSVAQVSTSSNRVEELLFFAKIPGVAVRWESGKRAAFSKAASPPSFPPLHVAANSAGVRSASAEWGRGWL